MSHACRRSHTWDDFPERRPPRRYEVEVTVSHDEIARLAYSYWEARGRTGGSALEDWLRAERELRALRNGSRWLTRRDALRRAEKIA